MAITQDKREQPKRATYRLKKRDKTTKKWHKVFKDGVKKYAKKNKNIYQNGMRQRHANCCIKMYSRQQLVKAALHPQAKLHLPSRMLFFRPIFWPTKETSIFFSPGIVVTPDDTDRVHRAAEKRVMQSNSMLFTQDGE